MLDDLHGPLATILRSDEGVRAYPYFDTIGKITIGVGRNLTDRGLLPNEIDLMLVNDMQMAVHECREQFPWFDALSEPRQVVLASMMFNMGWPALSGFTQMIDALSRRDYVTASADMLASRWASQVKGRAQRLALMMRNG
jgi:lysozyme